MKFLPICVLLSAPFLAGAEPRKPPIVNDPALRIELVAGAPDVEACTTVCGDPTGAVYIGNDPRDGRLNDAAPVCTITRIANVAPPPGVPASADRKRTLFAEKLYSPAGSAWHDGWLYVLHDPLLSRFKDTDGDGVADVREDLVSNLGVTPYGGLNDHVVSGFTLGMDGFFYISVGDRGIYQAKSAKDGSTITMQGGGIVRCRTDGTQLEIFSTGTRNHLQVNLDAEDNAFTRDNTDDGNGWWTRLTHHIEGGYYGYPFDYRSAENYGVLQPSQNTRDAMKQHGITRSTGFQPVGPAGVSPAAGTQQAGSPLAPQAGSLSPFALSTFNLQPSTFLPAMADFGGGSPTGGVCYLSDGLPEQYRGRHFFSEWGKGGLFSTELARDGATFKLVSDTKLVEADKGGDFRPMQCSIAADGSVLIADWGYGGWKSDRISGAVWRLYWPEAKPAPRLTDESKASIEELLAALGHTDRDQRLRAQSALGQKHLQAARAQRETELAIANKQDVAGQQLALAEEGKKLVTAVAALVRDEHAPTLQRVHAMWALHAIVSAFDSSARWRAARLVHWQPGGLVRYAPAEVPPPAPGAMPGRPFLRLPLSAADLAQAVAIDAVSSALRYKDAVLRAQAVRTLGELGSTRSVEDLVALFADSSADVRRRIVTSLARIGASDGRLVKVDEGLTDPDAWVRFSTRRMMQKLDDKFSIGDALRDSKSARYEAAWLTADSIYDEWFVSWFAAADQADATAHARAITSLGHIAYQPKPWDGQWWGTQPVKNPPAPKSVAWAGTPAAVEGLANALNDEEAGVRLAAATAFSQFVLSDPPATEGKKVDADGNAADAFGSTRSTALGVLRARLTAESDPGVRRAIIGALGVQKDPAAIGVFTSIAVDEGATPEFRETAIGALVSIGGDEAKKTVTQLAGAELSPLAARQIIKAVGEMKVAAAAPALVARLEESDDTLRLAAVKALGAIGSSAWPAEAAPALIARLNDSKSEVQVEAINTLANAKVKAALPALLALANAHKYSSEVFNALAAMPDESALPMLTNALADRNASNRRKALKALKTLRAKAEPLIAERLASGKIPAEFEAEIRGFMESGAIVKWQMIGPFENVWSAVHPPEKDVLAESWPTTENPTGNIQRHPPAERTAQLLAPHYQNAEGNDTAWKEVAADEQGHVDLAKVYKTNGMVCAYAFAEIETAGPIETKLFCGSDDQIAVWLNGAKILDRAGSRGFEMDSDEVPIRLAGGTNELLVKIGNIGGNWEFAARVPGVSSAKTTQAPDTAPEVRQRTFALAAKPDGSFTNAGDPAKGAQLFRDPAGALGGVCVTCHAIKGVGGQIGPDLGAIAANYRRPDLITSIHEPSKTIALGFEQALIETNGGETFLGAVRLESADTLTVVGADAQPHVVKKADVKSRKVLELSLMPPGLTLGLKPEDFVDLLAYLETLRGS